MSITISRSKDSYWGSTARILSDSGEVSEGDVDNSGGEFDLVQMDSAVVRQLQPTEEELWSFTAVAVDDRLLVCIFPGFPCFDDFLGGTGIGSSGGDGGGELTQNPSLDSSSLVK